MAGLTKWLAIAAFSFLAGKKRRLIAAPLTASPPASQSPMAPQNSSERFVNAYKLYYHPPMIEFQQSTHADRPAGCTSATAEPSVNAALGAGMGQLQSETVIENHRSNSSPTSKTLEDAQRSPLADFVWSGLQLRCLDVFGALALLLFTAPLAGSDSCGCEAAGWRAGAFRATKDRAKW